MTYVQYQGQCLPARVRKNPENFSTPLAFQTSGGILYLRSLKTPSVAGAASVKVATSVNNLKTCILGLKRAVPVRIGARLLTCFQPLQALFRIRVKTDRERNF